VSADRFRSISCHNLFAQATATGTIAGVVTDQTNAAALVQPIQYTNTATNARAPQSQATQANIVRSVCHQEVTRYAYRRRVSAGRGQKSSASCRYYARCHVSIKTGQVSQTIEVSQASLVDTEKTMFLLP